MKERARPWLWLILALLASVISWSYMHRILLPWEQYVNVTRGQLQKQMGDLYPRWVGTRELLLHGRDPYGEEVSHEIQIGFYGHPIEQSYNRPASEILDEQRFVYPLYVVLLLAPTVHMDFAQLEAWAPFVFAGLTVASIWLWLGVMRWRPPPLVAISTVLFVVASPQIVQGLRLRQFGLLVAFLIALASWCVVRQRLFTAGVLLALSTIKPQMVVLCIAWFLLWGLGEWRKRWPLLAGFGAALGALGGAGEILLPDWPREFLSGLEAYRHYFPTTSPLRLLLGDWAGGMLSVLVVVALLAYAWRTRHCSAESADFVHALALFVIATSLVLPLLTPFNQVLVLLPALMIVRDWERFPRAGRIAFSALAAWPWIVSLIFLIHPPSVQSMSRLPLLPSLLALLFPF